MVHIRLIPFCEHRIFSKLEKDFNMACFGEKILHHRHSVTLSINKRTKACTCTHTDCILLISI